MKLSYIEKQRNKLNYDMHTDEQIKNLLEAITPFIGDGEFFIEGIDLQDVGTEQTPMYEGRIIYVKSYDTELKRMVDFRHKLKNEGKGKIPYDAKASLEMKNRQKNISADVQSTREYKKRVGELVDRMWANFPFDIEYRVGSIDCEKQGSLHSTRHVLMLSEKAYKNIKDNDALPFIQEKMWEFKDNYLRVSEAYI
jgi:hypothetical protein